MTLDCYVICFCLNDMIFFFSGESTKMIVCKSCEARLKSVHEYIVHHLHQHRGGKIPCPDCPAVIGNQRHFYQHYNGHQQKATSRQDNSGETFRCSHCSRIFSSHKEFEDHVKSLETGILFNCPSCYKKGISTLGAYRKHRFR